MDKDQLRNVWEQRIAEYKASGKTQVTWCKEHQYKIHQFKYWLYKIEKEKAAATAVISPSNWVSVSLDEKQQDVSEILEIKIGEASIEVKPGFNPSFLADVVKTLKTLC